MFQLVAVTLFPLSFPDTKQYMDPTENRCIEEKNTENESLSCKAYKS